MTNHSAILQATERWVGPGNEAKRIAYLQKTQKMLQVSDLVPSPCLVRTAMHWDWFWVWDQDYIVSSNIHISSMLAQKSCRKILQGYDMVTPEIRTQKTQQFVAGRAGRYSRLKGR